MNMGNDSTLVDGLRAQIQRLELEVLDLRAQLRAAHRDIVLASDPVVRDLVERDRAGLIEYVRVDLKD